MRYIRIERREKTKDENSWCLTCSRNASMSKNRSGLVFLRQSFSIIIVNVTPLSTINICDSLSKIGILPMPHCLAKGHSPQGITLRSLPTHLLAHPVYHSATRSVVANLYSGH